MEKNFHHITAALGGACLCAKLVEEIALLGRTNDEQMRLMLGALIPQEHADFLSVFGNNFQNTHVGLKILRSELNNGSKEITRYWMNFIAIESRLRKTPEAMASLKRQVDRIPSFVSHYDLLSDETCAEFARIYRNNIRPVSPNFPIYGDRNLLEQEPIQNKIRSLLLAGVRFSVLWRQCGGTKWQLLFSKTAMLNAIDQQLR